MHDVVVFFWYCGGFCTQNIPSQYAKIVYFAPVTSIAEMDEVGLERARPWL